MTAALRAGSGGFVLKDTLAAGLLSAIRAVAWGDAIVAPAVTRRLIERHVGTSADPPALNVNCAYSSNASVRCSN